MIAKDKDGYNIDTGDIISTSYWLYVLAAPHLYRTLRRAVDPAHLTRLMDIWVAYAERGDRYFGGGHPRDEGLRLPVPEEQRRLLARNLRALIAAWTPPDLPAEITQTARAVLLAEGVQPTQGGDWDSFTFEVDGVSVEDALLWPEVVQGDPDPAEVD